MGTDDGKKKKTRLQKQNSVYALSPNAKWAQPTWAFAFFSLTLVVTFVFMIYPPSYVESFGHLRLFYTGISVALLLYRFWYYSHKQWFLYFIDLCYVSTYANLVSLWGCGLDGAFGRFQDGSGLQMSCSRQWLRALFTVAQGAVAGACFPLQTPLALHHPEAFESFFLHVSPMWLCYVMRWHFLAEFVTVTPGFSGAWHLAVNGFTGFYATFFLIPS